MNPPIKYPDGKMLKHTHNHVLSKNSLLSTPKSQNLACDKEIEGSFKKISPVDALKVYLAISARVFVIFWRHKFDAVASKPLTRIFR